MSEHPVVLIVEDDADWLEIYSHKLASDDYTIVKARTVSRASTLLDEQEFAVVATDLKLLGSNTGGFDILEMVQERRPDTQVIIFTGVGGKQDAFEAMRRGAYDYVTKPLDYDHVKRVLHSAIEVRAQKLAYRRQTPAVAKVDLPFPQKFVGSSQVIKQVLRQVATIIDSTQPVLIWGASGTGKALITETIHLASKRRRFVLVNCGVFSETTLERNLFGFEQGAFVGAVEAQQGLLEQASGGTLVLDRVNGLSRRLQNQIFSALYHQRVRRLGSTQTIGVDVRVLATSPFDLTTSVEQGLFSKELYDYLSGSIIELPPLKERRDEQTDDVLLLTGYFLDKYGTGKGVPPTLSEAARHLLQTYDFPGNVRELEEAIQVAVIKATEGIIEPDHLPDSMQAPSRPTVSFPQPGREPFPEGVICACGRSLSEQAALTAQSFDTKIWAYLSTGTYAPWYQATIGETMGQFGLTPYDPHLFINGDVCDLCHPLLISQVAIIDVSAMSADVFYDLGLAHALGVPYLLLKHTTTRLPHKFTALDVAEYEDAADLQAAVVEWLAGLVGNE